MLLNFKDASLDAVLEYLSEAAGLVVVKDSRLDGRITVMSRQPVTVDEAVSLLDTVLRAKGYAAIRNERTLKIVTVEQAKKELIPVRSGNDPAKIKPTDQMVTQIIPIRYADAIKLKADLAALMPAGADLTANASSNTLILTSTEASIRRVVEIIRAIDVHMSEVSQVKVFQLKYANASNAARLITEIFKEDQPAQAGGLGGGRRAFRGPGGPEALAALLAPPTAETGARATKVTASSDDRTNTLIISASPDTMKVIEQVVLELDANPAAEQAVFVYRVKNGEAKNIESVLNNLFGWSTSGTSSAARQPTTRAAGGTAGSTGGTFGSRTTGGAGGRGLSSTTGTGGAASTGSGRAATTGSGRAATTGFGARAPSAGTVQAASDLTGQVYVVADENTNSLLVTTSSKNFDRVQDILQDLDRAVPQVLIKVLIAEVTHDNSLDLGAEFSILNLRASGKGMSIGTNFRVGSETTGLIFREVEDDITAAIRAIATTAKLDVLSRPYILTSDNQQASIMVGQEVPFITNTRTTETGQTINTIQYDDIGIILNVTPHINPQGLVTLDVAPEISTLTGETVPISETVNAPVFAKRTAQCRVAIRDGQTIVIGGLMEDRTTESVNKVPVLGDIPGLGLLFRRTIRKKTKTELLIFLTPHVAQQPEDLEGMSKDEVSGSKVIRGAVSEGTFDEHLKGMERGAAPRPVLPPGLAPAPAPVPAPAPAPAEETEPAEKRDEPEK